MICSTRIFLDHLTRIHVFRRLGHRQQFVILFYRLAVSLYYDEIDSLAPSMVLLGVEAALDRLHCHHRVDMDRVGGFLHHYDFENIFHLQYLDHME